MILFNSMYVLICIASSMYQHLPNRLSSSIIIWTFELIFLLGINTYVRYLKWQIDSENKHSENLTAINSIKKNMIENYKTYTERLEKEIKTHNEIHESNKRIETIQNEMIETRNKEIAYLKFVIGKTDEILKLYSNSYKKSSDIIEKSRSLRPYDEPDHYTYLLKANKLNKESMNKIIECFNHTYSEVKQLFEEVKNHTEEKVEEEKVGE